jgi:hypothetical protein
MQWYLQPFKAHESCKNAKCLLVTTNSFNIFKRQTLINTQYYISVHKTYFINKLLPQQVILANTIYNNRTSHNSSLNNTNTSGSLLGKKDKEYMRLPSLVCTTRKERKEHKWNALYVKVIFEHEISKR